MLRAIENEMVWKSKFTDAEMRRDQLLNNIKQFEKQVQELLKDKDNLKSMAESLNSLVEKLKGEKSKETSERTRKQRELSDLKAKMKLKDEQYEAKFSMLQLEVKQKDM